MKYKFEPMWFRINKSNRPNWGLSFNFNTYSSCLNSYGIYIYIQPQLFGRSFNLCLKPIGEFYKSKTN